MSGNIDLFTDLHDISSPVGLPNGKSTTDRSLRNLIGVGSNVMGSIFFGRPVLGICRRIKGSIDRGSKLRNQAAGAGAQPQQGRGPHCPMQFAAPPLSTATTRPRGTAPSRSLAADWSAQQATTPASIPARQPEATVLLRQVIGGGSGGSCDSKQLTSGGPTSGVVLEQEIEGDVYINPEYLRGSSTKSLGCGYREKRPPSWHRNYVTHTLIIENIDPATSTIDPPQSHSSGKPFPIACHVEYNRFPMRHKCFLATITKGKEPSLFKEAVKDVGWRNAMQDEIDALEHNGTWTIEDLPPGKRAIGSGWRHLHLNNGVVHGEEGGEQFK
uniref:Uncharacterized protein n=1 Tax=Chenopodium quinoa TaxID=63459 RepID=A0A803N6H6_CHEQI